MCVAGAIVVVVVVRTTRINPRTEINGIEKSDLWTDLYSTVVLDENK